MKGEENHGMTVDSLFSSCKRAGWFDHEQSKVEKNVLWSEHLFSVVNKLMDVETTAESFDQIVHSALSLFNADRGFFLIRNKQKYFFKSGFEQNGRQLKKENFCILGTLIRKAIESHEIQYREDNTAHQRPSLFNLKPRRTLHHYCCPVVYNNELIGVLYLVSPQPIDVTEKIIQKFTRFAAGTIHHVWSLEKLKQQTRRDKKDDTHARIAHEMNNAISAAFGNVEIASYYLKNQHNSQQVLKRLYNAGEQLLQMRRFSHALMGENSLYADKKPVSINEAVSEFMKTIAPVYIRKKAIIETDLRETPFIHADQNQMVQVIHNLVKNALEAQPEGVRIRISTRLSQKTNHVILSVMDDGPGIEKQRLNSIFYRSFKKSGNGYGLGICREIVESHDGNLTVKSSPGQGTYFAIKLPVAQDPQKDHEYRPAFEI